MSLLRTTKQSRLGTERLSSYSYSQSRRENNAHPWSRDKSNGTPSSIDWATGGAPSMSTQTMSVIGGSHDSTRRNSTDDELNSIVRNASTSMLGGLGESKDPTEESVPAITRSSSGSSSSFSVTRAFGARHNRYESPKDRYESPSLPPRAGTQPVKASSPVKSKRHESPEDRRQSPSLPPRAATQPVKASSPVKSVGMKDRSQKKIPVSKKMNLMAPSISVGRVEVQKGPLPPISPSPPMTVSAKSRERDRKAMSSRASLEEVSTQDKTLAQLDMEKEKDRKRATRLLNKVDESKQASLKVQQAREAAKAAIEKARRARAEKDKKGSSSAASDTYAPNNPFNDDLLAEKDKKVSSSISSEIYVPNNPFNDNISELDVPNNPFTDKAKKVSSSVVSKMYVANNPFNDDLFTEKGTEGSSSVAYDIPVRFALFDDDSAKDTATDKYSIDATADKYGQDEPVDDVTEMAAGNLAPPKNLDEHYAQVDAAKKEKLDKHFAKADATKKVLEDDEIKVKSVDCVTEICNLWDEEMLLLQLKRSGAILDDTKFQAEQAVKQGAKQAEAFAKAGESAIRSQVTFANDTLAQNFFMETGKEIDFAKGMTWESSELSYLSIPKKDPPTGLSRSESVDEIKYQTDYAAGTLNDKPKKKAKHPSIPETMAPPLDDKEDDWTYKTENELDEIMNMAAGLLGREPERKKKPRPPNPPVPKEIGGGVQMSGGSAVDGIQSNNAVPQRAPASIVKAQQRGNNNQGFLAAFSGWSDNFFSAPEEEDFDSADKQGNEAKSKDVPHGTEMGGKGESLLAAAVHDKVSPKKSDRKPVPPPPEAFSLKEISTSTSSKPEPISSPKMIPTSPHSESEPISSSKDRKLVPPPPEAFSLKEISTSTSSDPEPVPSPKMIPTSPRLEPEPISSSKDRKPGPPSLEAFSLEGISTSTSSEPKPISSPEAVPTLPRSDPEAISSPKAMPSSPRSKSEPISSPRDNKAVYPPPDAFGLKAMSTSTRSEAVSPPHPTSTLEVLSPDALALADKLTEKSLPSVDFPNSITQTKPTKQKKTPFKENIVSCPMIDVLLDDESAPRPTSKAQRSEQQVSLPSVDFPNSIAQTKPTKQKKTRFMENIVSCPMISVLLDDESAPRPTSKVQRSEHQVGVESTCALPTQPKSNVQHSDQRVVLESTCAAPVKPKTSAQHSEQWAVQESTTYNLRVQSRSNVQQDPAKLPESTSNAPVQPEEAKEQRKVSLEPFAANEKLNKNEMTILDSDDEFWDTLSSIASTKVSSIKRVSHPHLHHKHPLPVAENLPPVKPTKATQPFGGLICNFWPSRNLPKQSEEEEHTLDSSEESIAPEIPREISFLVSLEVEQKQRLEEATSGTAQALDKVDTLITKGSSCSSESSVLFNIPSKNNSFQAEDQLLKLDEAITRGQEMAETIGASSDDTSGVVMVPTIGASRDDTTGALKPRHGNDEGEEAFGSPSLVLHDSLTSKAISDSIPRKIADKKHPWNKRGPVLIPKAKSTPILKEEKSELAAALRTGPMDAPGTDEADVALDTTMSSDNLEELSDLIMSLTRSNGDDEFGEYEQAQHNLQLQTRTGEVISSSSSSSEAEVTVMAQSNGKDKFEEHDAAQLDSQLHPKPDEVVFSPSSNEVEVVLASPCNWKVTQNLEETALDRHLLDIIGYVSPTQSYDDESDIIPERVMPAPSNVAVKKQSSNNETTQVPLDGYLTNGGEENNIAPEMNDLLSKYDAIVQLLLNEKRTGAGRGEVGDSHDVEIAVEALREERERVLGTSGSKTPSPLRQTQVTKLQEGAVQMQSSVLHDARDSASPPISPMRTRKDNASPPRSPVRTDQKLQESASPPSVRRDARDSASPPISPMRTQTQGNASPPKSRVQMDQKLQEPASPPSVRRDARDSASPPISPTRTRTQDNASPPRSRVQTDQMLQESASPPSTRRDARDSASPPISPMRTQTQGNASPPRSRVQMDQKLQEPASLPSVRRGARDSASPSISPTRTRTQGRASPPRSRVQMDQMLQESASPPSVRRDARDSASPPISPTRTRTRGSASPPRSRVQTDQKLQESVSPLRSTRNEDFTSRPQKKASPKSSPDQSSRLASRSRARTSPTRSPGRSSQHKDSFPGQEQQSRDIATPMRSPRRSMLASRSFDGDSIARTSFYEKKLHSRLSWSPSRSPRHEELALRREQLEKRRKNLSPTRSPSRRASSLQSRDVTPPTRSAGIQERVSPSRSPLRPMFARRARPRPEEMFDRMRRSRTHSLTPVRPVKDWYYDHDLELTGTHSFEHHSQADMRKPEMVADVVRRIYSPKRQRERLFVDGDDYAEKSRVVRKQLNLARRTCQSINDSHESLFEELQEFKRKLSRHSMRKDDERALVSESRGALKDFHNRLEHIRKMRASGRDSPDTVDAVERALEEAWEEFDSVRRVMLANLTILNDAKEELMRERMLEEEESDEGHIRSLARMMYEIRDREHDKTEQALESLRSRRYVHGARSGYGY